MLATRALLVSTALLFGAAASDPTVATEMLRPVDSQDLDQFIGSTVYGAARAPLGVISTADRTRGLIGVFGSNGEFAMMHTSTLARNGVTLRAPTVSIADFARAARANMTRPGATLIYPHIIIEEPPLG